MSGKTEWRPIEGFEGIYEVSNRGKVRSLKRAHRDRLGRIYYYKSQIIRPSKNKQGYLRVNLRRPGSPYTSLLVHRVVAIAFLPTHDRTLEVNHKDARKTNCAASNLEWATRQANMDHMNLMHGRSVRVESICNETGIVRTFPSAAAAARSFANAETARKIIAAARNGEEAFGHRWREAVQ